MGNFEVTDEDLFELFNPEIDEKARNDFEIETSSLKLPDVTKCKDLYPDYFVQGIEETLDEGFQFFNIKENIPSPLVWLMVNNPVEFLSACDMYILLYKSVIDKINKKETKKVDYEAQVEIKHIIEEFKSYFLTFDFKFLRNKLGDHISDLYFRIESDLSNKKDESYNEQIKYLEIKYSYLLDNKSIERLENRIKEFYSVLMKLDETIENNQLFTIGIIEDKRPENIGKF